MPQRTLTGARKARTHCQDLWALFWHLPVSAEDALLYGGNAGWVISCGGIFGSFCSTDSLMRKVTFLIMIILSNLAL